MALTKIDRIQKEALRREIKAARGDINIAAKSLGVCKKTAYNWIEKYGLTDYVNRCRKKASDSVVLEIETET